MQKHLLRLSARLTRRAFFAGVSAAVVVPSGARAVAISGARALQFENLHTGERLLTSYWENGGYLSDAVRQIAWVLRDHRTNEVHPIDPRLLDLLHALGHTLSARSPFQVISGYRSPATNAMLAAASEGVSRKSLHTEGMAIDIRVPGIPLATLRDRARNLRAGGVGFYPRSDFVHVDVGRVRYW